MVIDVKPETHYARSGDIHIPWVGESADEVLDEIAQFVTGDSRPVEVERVLATVLFTDIVGSTQHMAAIGDQRWRALRDRHDALVRHELSRYRGREVETAGDSFLATFDGPARAIRWAQAICHAVRPLGIEVRAGLHTGEIELVGDRIGGLGEWRLFAAAS